jgi:Zn-dependent peptidase ImmA (M78 family)
MLEFPAENVPKIQVDGPDSIERAAETCRDLWGLGRDTPILNMGRVLERAGVLLLEHDAQSDAIDAFSRSGERLAVLMNTSMGSPSRMRFNLAHETGHLVMHRGARARRGQKEEEANRFGGAFLLPRRAFSLEFPRGRIDWEELFRLKERWGASVALMIKRAFDLNLIDAARYRTAFKYMSMRGWRKEEPYELAPIHPELLNNAFSALREVGKRPIDAANELGWKPATFEELSGIAADDPGPLHLVTN